ELARAYPERAELGDALAAIDEARFGRAPVAWDAPSDRSIPERCTLTLDTVTSHCVAASPTGTQVAVGTDHEIRCYSLDTGKLAWNLPVNEPSLLDDDGLPPCVRAISFSPDGNLVAAAMTPDAVGVYDDGCVVKWRHALETSPRDVAIDPRGRYVAASCLDGTIRVWRLQTGEVVDVLRGHTEWVLGVQFVGDRLV